MIVTKNYMFVEKDTGTTRDAAWVRLIEKIVNETENVGAQQLNQILLQ